MAAAVSLTPGGTSLQVVRNPLALGQFEIIPDRPLEPSTAYTLTVSRRATDAFGQPIPAPITLHFTTGQLSTTGHLLVLAGPGLGDATEVVLAQLRAPATGLPIPAEVLDAIPLCTNPDGCGVVAPGQAAAVIDDAALSAGGQWLAVVQTDTTRLGATPLLRIINLETRQDQLDLAGATWPAWSPDGSTLAFVAADSSVQLYDPVSGSLAALQPGSPPSGTPVWTSDGDALAIPVGATATSPAHVDLADPAISARYQIPALVGSASNLVAAPQGEELALELSSPSSPLPTTWVADPSGGLPPLKVGTDMAPVGFTDDATLVVALNAPLGSSQLGGFEIATGVVSAITTTLGEMNPESAVVAPSGRQIAYITTMPSGAVQAVIANADGSGPLPLTSLAPGLQALSVRFGG
jgi:Tol biopolymer transport system component